MRRKQLISILLLCTLTMCIDLYNPELRGNESGELVIEGLITDQAAAHYVKITTTKGINDISSYPKAVTGATVSLKDDEGNTFPLLETDLGVYTSEPTLQGVPGRSYYVHIFIDDQEYVSEPELLTPGGEISEVHASFEEEFIAEGTPDVQSNVVVFNVDVTNTEGASDFYKYDWDATYMIESLYRDFPDSCSTIQDYVYVPQCYVSENAKSFVNILSLEGYEGELYAQHYFTYMDPNIRFMLRYSLNVAQYSMTKRAFSFWNAIKKQSFGTGSIFDPPPSKIIGNLRSVTNPQEPVLGYFMASSVHTKRVFFSPEFITSDLSNFENCDCQPWRSVCKPPLPPDVLPPPLPPKKPFCCVCTYYPNSTAEKPSYWID